MMKILAMLALLCGVSAQHHHKDPFAGSGCNCSTFCAGSCAINATKPMNMTVYRMTMKGVVDMVNKDTGGVSGDTSFVLSKRSNGAYCEKDPTNPMCSHLAQFGGDEANSTDLIIEFEVEVDGEWGPYLECNPDNTSDPSPHQWHCGISAFVPPPAPTDWPKQCKGDGLSGYNKLCSNAKPVKEEGGKTLAECCDLVHSVFLASGFNYFPNNQTCAIFRGFGHISSCPDGITGYHAQPDPHPDCNCTRMYNTVGRQNLSVTYGSRGSSQWPAGGIWYSHPQEGMCKEGGYVGDGTGCTWRVTDRKKVINATCMYNHVNAAVERTDKGCFESCPNPQNVTSTCYSKCYLDATHQMTVAELTAPWTKAFQSTDKLLGGCPPVAV